MLNVSFVFTGYINGRPYWTSTEDDMEVVWNGTFWEILNWPYDGLPINYTDTNIPLTGWQLIDNTTITATFNVSLGICLPSPSVTPSITISATPSVTPSTSVGASVSPSATPSITPSTTPSVTPSLTPSITISPTPSITATPSTTPPLACTGYMLTNSGPTTENFSYTACISGESSSWSVSSSLLTPVLICARTGTVTAGPNTYVDDMGSCPVYDPLYELTIGAEEGNQSSLCSETYGYIVLISKDSPLVVGSILYIGVAGTVADPIFAPFDGSNLWYKDTSTQIMYRITDYGEVIDIDTSCVP